MRTVLFDVTRLFVRGSRFSPTGIDRVVTAYASWLLSRPDVELRPVLTVGGRLYAIPLRVLSDLIEKSALFARTESDGGDKTWELLVAALNQPTGAAPPLRAPSALRQMPARARWHLDLARRTLLHARPTRAPPGSIYFNVSHTGLDQPTILGKIRARGADPIVMVHDLIPISHPEYCSPKSEARHIRRMDQVIAHASVVITNSATTALEFEVYAERSVKRPAPRTIVAPLGVQPAFFNRACDRLAERPYFVCVGTLEARKNVAFLLALWRQLAEQLGADAPRLVLVGRRGWENESVLDHLQRSKSANLLVHEVSDLRDEQLARLVAGASALLSPSLAEGYDLPVVEALALRTPVIASRIPVHSELAQQATLLEPLDGPSWLSAMVKALSRQTVGPPAAVPTWSDHFERLSAALWNEQPQALGMPPRVNAL